MWKKPDRPRNRITQSLNDGIVTVCNVTDIALPGYKPRTALKPKITLRYAEQRLGINRLYMAKQVQVEIVRVVRVQNAGNVNPQDVAVIGGEQYRIESVQTVLNVYPPCVDLALEKVKQVYEVVE